MTDDEPNIALEITSAMLTLSVIEALKSARSQAH
jgi:hypothetical protein